MLKRHLVLIIFFIILLSLILSTYKDYGIPWDEKVFFNTGKYFVVKLFNFLNIQTNLSTGGFEPTPYHLRGHGVFMDMLTVFAGLQFRNFNFETLHLIRALFALPIFFLLYWIVAKLVSKVYGLISIVFLLLFPRFYPEIYYNAVDIPTALLFIICLAYFIYYSTTKQSFLKSIIFGLILGITINQRLLLFYLPVVNFFFLLVNVILNEVKRSEGSSERSERKNAYVRFFAEFTLSLSNVLRMTKWGNFFANQLTIFFSTIFFLHLTHPFLLTNPLKGLFEILSHARQYPWNAAVLFDGQFYQAGVKPLPLYYLPKTLLITIPPIALVLFFIGNIYILLKLFKIWAVPARLSTSGVGNSFLTLYVLIIFYFPILLTIFLKPTLYDSWRQFLFLTIPMIIIAMYGLDAALSFRAIARNLAKRNYANTGFLSHLRSFEMTIERIIILILCINLFLIAKQMIALHPYEYLYYNSLVGGLKGAYGKYETDYWGLGFKDAVLWFNKNVNDPKKSYKIFVEGDPLSSSYYFKPNTQLITDPLKADYIFTFTRWNFHVRHPGKIIFSVEREDVPLIFIKQQ